MPGYQEHTRVGMKIVSNYGRTPKRLLALVPLLTALAIIAAACGNGEDSVAPAATATPATVVALPVVGLEVQLLPRTHILVGETFTGYNSIPPTSGIHWETDWARCGVYDIELPDEQVVHNMEHGQVIISHNLTDEEEIKQLKRVASNIPSKGDWLIVRHYTKLAEGEVAITAWGWLDKYQGVDEAGIQAFFVAHANRGPESISCTSTGVVSPPTPATSEGSETTTPPSDGEDRASFSGADELVLFAQETTSVPVNLDAADTLRVDYKVTALSGRGGSLEGLRTTNAAIIVTLTNPEGEQLELAREGVDERVQLLSGTVETVVGMNGEYLIGFSNPTPIAITVSYEYFVYPVEED